MRNTDTVLSFDNVGVFFEQGEETITVIEYMRRKLSAGTAGNGEGERFYALRNISFDVRKGEVVGFIGPNGAGKTTMLKLISGILTPDEGVITRAGGVSSLIDLGAGFHQHLTGYENIYLHGALLGLDKATIDTLLPEIVAFSGIKNFLDQPIHTYSMGMQLRLGFSIATAMVLDILVVDEVLSVGDAAFQRKGLKRIREFKESGKTIIFVTHDMSMVSALCDRAFYLNRGEVVRMGNPSRVVRYYLQTYNDEMEGISCVINDLTMVFQEGKLLLFTDVTEMTRGVGGYVNLYLDGQHHQSYRMDWEMSRAGKNSIKARGSTPLIPMALDYEITILEDEILFEIKAELEEPFHLEELAFNIPLNPAYDAWIADDDAGTFPPITTSDAAWHDMLQRKYHGGFLRLLPVESGEEAPPSILFENLGEANETAIKLFNSDFNMNSRVLQILNTGFAARCGSLPAGTYPLFKGRISTKKVDAKGLLAEAARKKTFVSGEASVEFVKSRLALSFAKATLTTRDSVYTAIKSDDRYHTSLDGNWKILKKTEEEFILSCDMDTLPIECLFRMLCKGEGGVAVDVTARIGENIKLQEFSVNHMLSTAYNYWISGVEEGGMPRISPLAKGWHDILQKRFEKPEVELLSIGEDGGETELPKLTFRLGARHDMTLMKLYNTDYISNSRGLQLFSLDFCDSSKEIRPGEYRVFSYEILPEKANAAELIEKTKKRKTIFSGDAAIELAGSTLVLSAAGKELTKKLAIYASINSAGRFHDSSNASWSVLENTESSILLSCKLDNLPLTLYWTFERGVKNSFHVTVQGECAEEFPVSREQFNIMLDPVYDTWSADGEARPFPPEFNDDFGGDWQVLFEGNPGDGPISLLAENGSPAVTLESSSTLDPLCRTRVVNSDKNFQSHVLQCVRLDRGRFPLGRHLYYEGVIKLD